MSSHSAKQHNQQNTSDLTRLRLLVVSSHLDKIPCLSCSAVDKQTPSSIVAQAGTQQNSSIKLDYTSALANCLPAAGKHARCLRALLAAYSITAGDTRQSWHLQDKRFLAFLDALKLSLEHRRGRHCCRLEASPDAQLDAVHVAGAHTSTDAVRLPLCASRAVAPSSHSAPL